ncbi:hypothetical protein Q6A51_16170 [Pseudomonas sp. KFB-139]|uniref:Nucleotidyltransferase domain-containing protein n=1 Tax=Pseudomonas serbiensis TaxID=3064350 RepID=A0ABT9CW66_9PSED|nr:hypothetical protein [Pseudomonas sp. KFB-138]MDO7928326.1 hypothetical protein [Pseudomonas sp. KFB-138]
MYNLVEIKSFVDSLKESRIPYTLALTGSTARGELRSNSSPYDYNSDTDILCILAPSDIAAALSCKEKCSESTSLILMSSEALNHPSNAVLSIAFDSLIINDLHLSQPLFDDVNAAEFIAYQLQPLAYYTSNLRHSTPALKRRLYSKVAITCLKLLYLADHSDKRSFIYESEVKQHNFTNVDEVLVHSIINRELPDEPLQRAAEHLEKLVIQCPLIVKAASVLTSTKLYLSDKETCSAHIIEAVFLENNKLKRSDALFIRAA